MARKWKWHRSDHYAPRQSEMRAERALNKRGMRANCLECGQLRKIHGRGLCYKCYHIPGVAARYPSISTDGEEKATLRRLYYLGLRSALHLPLFTPVYDLVCKETYSPYLYDPARIAMRALSFVKNYGQHSAIWLYISMSIVSFCRIR